ncbi:MAG: thiol reductant ABC exporter subunit CydC [Cellulomonadaceae bacterium]
MIRRWREDPLWRAVAHLHVSPRRVARAIALGVATLGSALALAAVSAWLIARASQMPPVLTLSVAVVSVRAFGISRGVFRYLERLASHDVALRGMAALRTDMYTTLAAGPTSAVAPLRRGELLARVGQDVDDVGDVVVRAIVPAGVAAVLGVGASVLVGVFLPAAGVVLALCLLVAGVLAPWLTARATRETEARSAQARDEVAATALTILEDAPQIVVAGELGEQLDRLQDADAQLTRATDDGARPLALAAAISNAAVGVAVLAAIVLGVPAVGAGRLDPVELAVVVLTPLAAFEASMVLPAAAVQMHRSRQAAQRIMALLDAAAPPDADDSASSASASSTTSADSASFAGANETVSSASPAGTLLRARALLCGWPGNPPVLDGLDLELAPGRLVALVGPSGIGKTTALLTLAGLVPPRGGTLESQGSRVLTAEDAHLFDTSVLENLRVARGDVNAQEACAALETVGLGPWLTQLPDGLDTVLGADGATVSGGERRRLLLARALLNRAPLMLVDEPAEHLDPQGADAFFADVLTRAVQAGRGVLVATHRLSGLGAADEVIVLRPATVPGAPAVVGARGTHEYLLEHEAPYRTAWEREQLVADQEGTR